jgi:hypothetical protein
LLPYRGIGKLIRERAICFSRAPCNIQADQQIFPILK